MNNNEAHSNEELYCRFINGNGQAFAEIHSLFKARLLYYAQRMLHNWDDAEDIVADVFGKLWSGRQQMASLGHIKNFLFLTVRRQAINHLQKISRREALLQSFEPPEADDSNLQDILRVEEEMMHLLNRAVEKLPGECRKIFELSWQQELAPAEIALLLNMNAATVRSQKRRAIQLIQNWIQENAPDALPLIMLLITIQPHVKNILPAVLHD